MNSSAFPSACAVPQGIYVIIEIGSVNFEAERNPQSDLPRRYAGNEPVPGRTGNHDPGDPLSLLQHLGFRIIWEKSHLSPSQQTHYMGFVLNSLTLTISLPEGKMAQSARRLLQREDVQ